MFFGERTKCGAPVVHLWCTYGCTTRLGSELVRVPRKQLHEAVRSLHVPVRTLLGRRHSDWLDRLWGWSCLRRLSLRRLLALGTGGPGAGTLFGGLALFLDPGGRPLRLGAVSGTAAAAGAGAGSGAGSTGAGAGSAGVSAGAGSAGSVGAAGSAGSGTASAFSSISF